MVTKSIAMSFFAFPIPTPLVFLSRPYSFQTSAVTCLYVFGKFSQLIHGGLPTTKSNLPANNGAKEFLIILYHILFLFCFFNFLNKSYRLFYLFVLLLS